MTVALHEDLAFSCEKLQQNPTRAIRAWESRQSGLSVWSYYERWTAAFEELTRTKDWVSTPEQPHSAHYQRLVREPIAVASAEDTA